jgi:WD40 repeat protein
MTALVLALLASVPDPSLMPGKPGLFVGHTDTVLSLAFSADGKQLATGSFDKTVRLWDVASKKPLASFSVKGAVSALAFSVDGKQLALGDLAYEIAVLNAVPVTDKLEPLKNWTHPDGVASLSFSPSGKELLAGGATATGELYTLDTNRTRGSVRARSAAWAKDGKTFVSTTLGEKVALWDAASVKPKLELAVPSAERLVSTDDLKLSAVYSGKDKEVRLLDGALKTVGQLPSTGGKGVSSVSLSHDGKVAATASDDRVLRLYAQGAGGKFELLDEIPLEHVGFVALSPDAKQVAVADGSLVKLYAVKAKEVKP